MNFRAFFLIFSILTTPLQANEDISCEKMRQMIKERSGEKSSFSAFQTLKDFFKLTLFKKKLGTPDFKIVEVSPQKIITGGPRKNPFTNHVIFLLGVDHVNAQESLEFQKRMQRYQFLKDKNERDALIVKKMVSARNLEKCEEIRKENNFSLSDFIDNHQELETLRIGKQFSDGHEAVLALAKILPKLKLPWEFRRGAGIEDVFHAIREEGLVDVVIVAHGAEGGEIADSVSTHYPKNFFEQFSPTLRSLSLFVCHSQESLDFYHLLEPLKNQLSYYPQRFLFTVKKNHIGRYRNVAPIRVFKYFMKGVDKALNEVKVSWQKEAQATTSPSCQIKVEGLHLSMGKSVLQINQQLAEIYTTESIPLVTHIPCSMLNEAENTFIFENVGSIEESAISEEFRVWVKMEGQEWQELEGQFSPHLTEENAIRKAKFILRADEPSKK